MVPVARSGSCPEDTSVSSCMGKAQRGGDALASPRAAAMGCGGPWHPLVAPGTGWKPGEGQGCRCLQLEQKRPLPRRPAAACSAAACPESCTEAGRLCLPARSNAGLHIKGEDGGTQRGLPALASAARRGAGRGHCLGPTATDTAACLWPEEQGCSGDSRSQASGPAWEIAQALQQLLGLIGLGAPARWEPWAASGVLLSPQGE